MTKFLFKVGLVLGAFIVLIFLGQLIFNIAYKFPLKTNYGITFSLNYANYLGLEWKQVYIKSLDELKIKNLRVPTYWSNIEKKMGEFNFEDVDFMIDKAENYGAKVILVVGFRQPRWPECYIPLWAKTLILEKKRLKILQFIQKTVERYKDRKNIWAYQVENEPFLMFFGENCEKGDKKFLKEEIELVRSISDKPIIISDSGELGTWILPMQLSDVFGTTVYRDVYNPVIGYLTYPILPYLYNVKSQIVRTIFAQSSQRTIIVELQAEPWLLDEKFAGQPNLQAQLFPEKKLENYINYAKKTGFDEIYLWGVEWWFWMAQNGHPEYLEYAKTLFK